MSAPLSTTARSRARRDRRPVRRATTTTAAANATPPTAYLDEWRDNVDDQLTRAADALQQAAITQERVMGILNDYDRRIKTLEEAPTQRRQDAYQRRGLTLNELYVLVTALGVLFAILSPHLGWH